MGFTPQNPADFDPSMGNYKDLKPFRFWCQKVLPLVYDDSLSYYEVLCKVVDYLNKAMEDVGVLHDDVDALHLAYQQLQSYVNNYFSTLDVQQEINNKLDVMASDGTLDALLLPYFNAYKNEINGIVANQNQNISNFEDTVNNSVNTQNSKISVLEGRMNSFSRLAEGSTTGDAELTDIRVGANGITYPTAGDAVRAQAVQNPQSILGLTEATNYEDGMYYVVAKSVGGTKKINANKRTLPDIDLKNSLEELESNFDYGYFTENSSIFTVKTAHNASSAGWVETIQYNSYYFITPHEIKLYVGTTSNLYYSIAIYNGEVSAANYIARYRNTDNNLPTKNNPLTVPIGYTVVVTIEYRDSGFVLYASNAPLILGQSMISQVENITDEKVQEFSTNNFNWGIITKDSSFLTAKPGYSASSVGWTPYIGYNSWYFTATNKIQIYPDERALYYYSICIFNESVSSQNYVARYRQSDGNMPTKDNPLTVNPNQVIVVTLSYNDKDFILYSSSEPILLGDQMVNQVNTLIANAQSCTMVEYSTDKYVITSNGIRFDLRHTVDDNINQDCWRFVSVSKNNTEIVNGDIIGVLLESGEYDFIGGVHGDEKIVNFVIKADGVDISEPTTICNKVTIFMYSHLYRPSSPTTNVIDRYVNMTIEKGKLTVENTFKCLVDNFALKYAYNSGLIGIYKPNVSFLASNTDVADLSDMPTAIDWNKSHDNYWYDAILTNGSIHIENVVGHEQPNYSARVHYFSNENPQRLKVYITTDQDSVWNTGHICNGKFFYEFQ